LTSVKIFSGPVIPAPAFVKVNLIRAKAGFHSGNALFLPAPFQSGQALRNSPVIPAKAGIHEFKLSWTELILDD